MQSLKCSPSHVLAFPCVVSHSFLLVLPSLCEDLPWVRGGEAGLLTTSSSWGMRQKSVFKYIITAYQYLRGEEGFDYPPFVRLNIFLIASSCNTYFSFALVVLVAVLHTSFIFNSPALISGVQFTWLAVFTLLMFVSALAVVTHCTTKHHFFP